MSTLTEEQRQRLYEFAHCGLRPRNMRWLPSDEFEQIKESALVSCFAPPDTRPQCERRELSDPPPAALARQLRAEGKQFDPLYYLWHAQLKQAYRKFRLKKRNSITIVPLDDTLLETISDASFDVTLESTIAAETEREIRCAFTEEERAIVDLTAAGFSMGQINEETGESLYRVKQLRARAKRLQEEIEREQGCGSRPVLAYGCKRTMSASNQDEGARASERVRFVSETMTPEELDSKFTDLDPMKHPNLCGGWTPRSAANDGGAEPIGGVRAA